jgi:hypothetical protein
MTLPPWLATTLFVAACLIVPVVWGWLVNWLFVRYRRRRGPRGGSPAAADGESEDRATFSDYQI